MTRYSAPTPQTEAETTYYRGMSKDNDTTTVTLTDSQGGTHEDVDQLAGDTLETTDYNYAGGPVTGSTINSYWVSPATATRSRTGLPALTANATGQVETWGRQALTSGTTTTWRKTESDTSYDTDASSPTFGLPLLVYTHGDLSQTDQRQCAVTTYAPANGSNNLAGLPAEVETDAGACGGSSANGATAPTAAQTNALTAPTGVNRPADVVSDQRTFYDNPTLAATWPQPANPAWPQAAPTNGDISAIQVATGYTGGAFVYQTKSASVYDGYGRITDAYDGLGHKTHTAYTMANGLTTATNVSNPLGQSVSTTLDPVHGLPTSATDPNQVTTTTHYDGLGRLTAVWEHGRATTLPADLQYVYQVSDTGPTVVTTQKMNEAQGYATSTVLYDGLLRPRQTQDPTPQGGRLVTDTFYDTHGWTWKKNNAWWDSGPTPNSSLASVPDSQVHNQEVTAFDGAGRAVLTRSLDDSTLKSEVATGYDLAVAGDGDATVTVPLNGAGQPFTGATAKISVKDALGRTIETDQYTTPPGVTIDNGQGAAPITTVAISGGSTTASNGNPQATQYVFDKTGHQTDVKNLASGDDWKTGYNLLGQVTSKTDPDAGTSTMGYDAAGNITQTTDARGKTISLTYDALNRKTGEYAATTGAQAPANQLASWAYDNSNNAVAGMADPIGQLTTSSSYVGGSGSGGNAYVDQARGFNAFGESTGQTITIPTSEGALAGSYSYTHTYTPHIGLPDKDIYPAKGSLPAETVLHGYSTALDVPDDLGSTSMYTWGTTWNALGQAAQTELGSHTAAHAYITNTFDQHTGTLKDSKLANTAVSATPIDENSYTYDPAGNPTSQTETRMDGASETQCFGYDTLDRLVQAWTATDACQADPASNNGATVGSGIAKGAYWTSWSLDPLGERKTQTEHNLSGPGDTVTSYTYDGNGAGQAHTLTKTSTIGPSGASSTSTFSYDKNGDTAQRTTPDHGQQSLTWDDAGQLTAVTGASNGSSYIYDADGALLLQKDPGTTTLYLPGQQLALDTTSGQIAGTRFFALPGGGEAVRTGSGSAFNFELGDQHGTGTLTLDSTLATPTWRQQTPYGAPRGEAPTIWPDNHGFLNQPQDTSTGLTDVGARWYDPTTATFASLDPLFEATDPQQQAGYNYAASNPITNSDPGGLYTCRNGNEGCDEHGNPPCSDGNCNADTHKGDCKHTECGTGPDQNDHDPYRGSDGKAHSTVQNSGNDATAAARALAQAQQRREALKHKIAALTAQLTSELKSLGDYEQGGHAQKYLVCSAAAALCVGGGPDRMMDLINGYFGLDELDKCVNGNYSKCLPALIIAASSVERGSPGKVKLCDSFSGDTQVLLADGKSNPIEQIKVGDEIANGLPGQDSGVRNKTHKVTAVHVTRTDRDYTDITVNTDDGAKTITGTAHHLYWGATTRAWTRADQLHVGDSLQTSGRHDAVIVALRSYTASMVTYNLTVDHLHTYYVQAGDVPVLVHNSGCGVTGYSGHAEERMAERGISEDMIEQTVSRGRQSRGNSPGTTKYTSKKIWVVLNRDGKVVSVGRN